MPVQLVEPMQAVVIDQAKIMKIEIELNPAMGGPYIDLYVVWGREVGGMFVEHIDPNNAAQAQYYRIAPGQNPTARPSFSGGDQSGPGPALGKCETCETWHPTAGGDCWEDGCDGTVQPYDGFQRLVATPPVGATLYDVIKNGAYAFLTAEEVPDPTTQAMQKLLNATE